MSNLFENIDDFIIEKSIVKVRLLKNYEKAKYNINFYLKKINPNGLNHWEIKSNIEGFEFLGAYDSEGNPFSQSAIVEENLENGLVRVLLLLDNYLDTNNKTHFSLEYINRIESEVLNDKFLRKSYGIILTRSFGSKCLQYNLSVSVEDFFYYIKKVIPRFHFKKDKEFCFTDIPTQKPTSVALIIPNKIERIYVIVGFIFTALGGYYIPIWFNKLIDLINKKP